MSNSRNWTAQKDCPYAVGSVDVATGATPEEPGNVTFAQAFGPGPINVYWALQDASTPPRSMAGVGSLAAGTIDVSTPASTFDGTTYDQSPSGVIALVSPVTVRCTVNASVFDEFDVQIGLRETAATGVVSNPPDAIVTPSGPTTVDVAAGDGEIVDGYTDRRNPTRLNVSWVATPGIIISMPGTIGTVVIYVDNTGTVQQNPGVLTNTQRRLNVQLAYVYYKDGVIDAIQQGGILSNEVGNTLYDLLAFMPLESRTSGFSIAAVTGQLQIWANEGTLLSPGVNIETSLTDPNLLDYPQVGNPTTPVPFDVLFEDGSTYLSAQTTLPAFYESAPGVATALSGNKATIHYVFRTLNNELLVQLGQVSYATGSIARSSLDLDRQTYSFFAGSTSTLLTTQIYMGDVGDFDDASDAGIVNTGIAGGSTSFSLADAVFPSYAGFNPVPDYSADGPITVNFGLSNKIHITATSPGALTLTAALAGLRQSCILIVDNSAAITSIVDSAAGAVEYVGGLQTWAGKASMGLYFDGTDWMISQGLNTA